MLDDKILKEEVIERFPEGLTGILALGGTRMSYLLETSRNAKDPGTINDFSQYTHDAFQRALSIVKMFLDLGGKNLIMEMFSYQLFYERGDDYAKQAVEMCLTAIDDERLNFYKTNNIDPYFVGIDTLLHLPEDHIGHQLAQDFVDFHNSWDYQPHHRKLIWEVAPIPLFSFWNAHRVMGEEAQAILDQHINQSTDLQDIHDTLYKYYSKAVYGTELPIPHFYLGTNRNGDVKMRAMLPIALLCGGPFRMFYTPYPSLFLTYDTFKYLIYDLIHGKRLRSEKLDYSGQMTPELVDAEYERIMALSHDQSSTIGLTRLPPQ